MFHRLVLAISCTATLIVTNQLVAQDREHLTKPVYKVSKSDEVAGPSTNDLIRGPAPVLQKATDAIAAEMAESDDNSAPLPNAEAAPVDEAADEPSADGISEAQATLNTAVEDARVWLEHIQQNVDDYQCLFIKQENVKGQVLPPEYMRLKVRNERRENGQVVVPFSAYFKFVKPKEVKNREVLYVSGRYKGDKLLAKEGAGGRRFLPAMTLRPDSPFVMCSNRYPISEVGVENLTRRLIERSTEDRNVDDCKITYTSGAKIDGRPCKFLQVVRPTPKVGPDADFGMNVYLAQVFVDQELKVPIRYAAYTWPSVEGGSPEVVESYTYKDLKLNVGLTDEDFDADNPAYNF